MRHGMGNVQKEGLALVAFDEPDGAFGVPGGELGLVFASHGVITAWSFSINGRSG